MFCFNILMFCSQWRLGHFITTCSFRWNLNENRFRVPDPVHHWNMLKYVPVIQRHVGVWNNAKVDHIIECLWKLNALFMNSNIVLLYLEMDPQTYQMNEFWHDSIPELAIQHASLENYIQRTITDKIIKSNRETKKIIVNMWVNFSLWIRIM